MNKILQNQSIIVTRSESQSLEFSSKLSYLGAEVINIPSIEIVPLINNLTESTLIKIEKYNWIIFTSTNSINIFFELLKKFAINETQLQNIKFATVGNKTSEILLKYGYKSSITPEKFTANNLLNEFRNEKIKSSKILIPGSKISKKELLYGLQELCSVVDILDIYDTVKPIIKENKIQEILNSDYITFTSPSTVENFYEMYNEKLKDIKAKIICIGPVTQKKVTELFKMESSVPNEFNINGMIEMIIKHEKGLFN